MEQTNNSLTQKILSKINSGEIKSKPKAYFALKTAIFISASVFSFLIAVFLASFVAFAMKFNGSTALLFILALTAVVFVLLNFFLAKKFPYFYKKALIFDLLVFVVLTFLASFLVLKTPFHLKMLEISKQRDVPIFSPLYKCGCGCGCSAQKTCGCEKAGGQCNMNVK